MTGPEATSPVRARCVVWHPRGRPPHPNLSAALSRPGLRHVMADSPWLAFAHVTTKTGPSAPVGAEASVLLLVEPESLPQLAQVIDALDRYSPAAALWLFDLVRTPHLRCATAADVAPWRAGLPARVPDPVPRAPVGTPMLRISGEGSFPTARGVRPSEARVPSPEPDVKPPRPERAARPGVNDPMMPSPGRVPGPEVLSRPEVMGAPAPMADGVMGSAPEVVFERPLLTQEELDLLLAEDPPPRADEQRGT